LWRGETVRFSFGRKKRRDSVDERAQRGMQVTSRGERRIRLEGQSSWKKEGESRGKRKSKGINRSRA